MLQCRLFNPRHGLVPIKLYHVLVDSVNLTPEQPISLAGACGTVMYTMKSSRDCDSNDNLDPNMYGSFVHAERPSELP